MSQVQFKDFPNIVADIDYCDGQPRIDGTRITVSAILSYLAGGMSTEDLLNAFPVLKKEDILQSLSFANSQLQIKPNLKAQLSNI